MVLLRLPDHSLKFLMLVDRNPVCISQRVDRLLRASGKIDHFVSVINCLVSRFTIGSKTSVKKIAL